LIIVGYGTGRCGTMSLAKFLNNQEGWHVTHEKVCLGWYQAFTDTETAINDFTERPYSIIGDVGFYWINYLDLILRKFQGSRAINIKRDDDEVIESFWSYMNKDVQDFKYNQWKGYPFDSYEQTKDAIAFTVKRYRFLENEVRKLYPGVIYYLKTEDLNNEDKMSELLDWLKPKTKKTLIPFHTNTREQISKNDSKPNRLFAGVLGEKHVTKKILQRNYQ